MTNHTITREEIKNFIKNRNDINEKEKTLSDLLIEELYEILNWEDLFYNEKNKYCQLENGDDICDAVYFDGIGFNLHPKLLQTYANIFIQNKIKKYEKNL